MKTAHPVAKALLAALIWEAPQSLAFDELLSAAGSDGVREQASQILLATSLAGLTDLHTGRLPLVNSVSARPVASPLARHQALKGGPLTTLTHCSLDGDTSTEMKLLPLLDGTRDHRALAKQLRLTKKDLQACLQKLAKLGFLVQ